MLGSKHEETTDLTSRLQELAELGTPWVVAPRRPLDDVPPPPAPLVSWQMSDVVSGAGRLYVLGANDGPCFRSATWLRSARPTAS
jgi:hypothetical protein